MKPTVTDLEPTMQADGRIVWGLPASDLLPQLVPDGDERPASPPVVAGDGKIAFADAPEALSTLPEDRLATDDPWGRIIRSIQQGESGDRAQDTVEVRPGGQLVPVNKGEAGTPLSTLPEDRLAAPGRPSAASPCECSRPSSRGAPAHAAHWRRDRRSRRRWRRKSRAFP